VSDIEEVIKVFVRFELLHRDLTPLHVKVLMVENATVVKALLADLVARGLDARDGLLVVIDGAKALSSAVRAVFGAHAAVQRCTVHKRRNVADHLPEAQRGWVDTKLGKIFANPDPAAGLRDAKALATALARKHPGAAASLREGLDEMFTVTRLGITGTLARTLTTSNPIESMISIARSTNRNVTHWQDGQMVLRWTAAGMLNAQRSFRRVKGYSSRRYTATPTPTVHVTRNCRRGGIEYPWIVTEVPRDPGHPRRRSWFGTRATTGYVGSPRWSRSRCAVTPPWPVQRSFWNGSSPVGTAWCSTRRAARCGSPDPPRATCSTSRVDQASRHQSRQGWPKRSASSRLPCWRTSSTTWRSLATSRFCGTWHPIWLGCLASICLG
jgi:hypothetical protein